MDKLEHARNHPPEEYYESSKVSLGFSRHKDSPKMFKKYPMFLEKFEKKKK